MMRILDYAAMEKFVAERKPVSVDAGILNDWFWTAATVYEHGKWCRGREYVISSWAMPGFKATMPNGDVIEVAANREATQDEIDEHRRQSDASRVKLRESVDRWNAENRAAAEKVSDK